MVTAICLYIDYLNEMCDGFTFLFFASVSLIRIYVLYVVYQTTYRRTVECPLSVKGVCALLSLLRTT